MIKSSKLDIHNPRYPLVYKAWNKVFAPDKRHFEDTIQLILDRFHKLPDFEKEMLLNMNYYCQTPLNSASMKTFLSCDLKDNSVFNALVTGGRCNNEMPYEFQAERTADIDLASCYGSCLNNFDYPIGKPTIYVKPPNPNITSLSLKEFLEKYESQLVPNLYKITVSGKLSFEQDLIYSKLVSETSLRNTLNKHQKTFEDIFDDNAHLASDMVLLRREIIHGVITSDVLEILRKVSSSVEYNELMNLQVITAAWWPKEQECSVDEWIEENLLHSKHIDYDDEEKCLKDNRTRKWVKMPFQKFLQSLLDQRKKLKQELKNASDEETKNKLNAQQNSLKLMINTLYSVICSIYFSVGNTVVADNITARARCEVWKMAKALQLRQTITDGGFYQPEKVLQIKNKQQRKPSFNIFSDPCSLVKHRNIKIVSLGEKPWKEMFQHNPSLLVQQNIDELAKQHIDEFWAAYDFKLKMNIEHKLENFSLKTAYLNKANYRFMTFEKEKGWAGRKTAVRGVERDVSVEKNPYIELLENILLNDPKNVYLPKKLDYLQTSFLIS